MVRIGGRGSLVCACQDAVKANIVYIEQSIIRTCQWDAPSRRWRRAASDPRLQRAPRRLLAMFTGLSMLI
jgi:hypothetical protein